MGLTRTVEPTVLPVSVPEAIAYLRLRSEPVADLGSLIRSEAARCERVSGRALLTQTWRHTMDSFIDRANGAVLSKRHAEWWTTIELRPVPVQSIVSVAYIDIDGNAQAVSSSGRIFDGDSEPARLTPSYGNVWPPTRPQVNGVTITLIAGYGDAATSVPDEIREAIKKAVAYRYDHPENADEEFLDEIFKRFDYGRLP